MLRLHNGREYFHIWECLVIFRTSPKMIQPLKEKRNILSLFLNVFFIYFQKGEHQRKIEKKRERKRKKRKKTKPERKGGKYKQKYSYQNVWQA